MYKNVCSSAAALKSYLYVLLFNNSFLGFWYFTQCFEKWKKVQRSFTIISNATSLYFQWIFFTRVFRLNFMQIMQLKNCLALFDWFIEWATFEIIPFFSRNFRFHHNRKKILNKKKISFHSDHSYITVIIVDSPFEAFSLSYVSKLV